MITSIGTDQKDCLLDGRYKLIRQLGAGGMGRVFLAEDVVLHRQVAVKLLQPHCAADPRFVERLRREARAAAGLSHPHVVAVHDLGENCGAPYIVMQFVEGETLKDRIARVGSFPLEQACGIAGQVLEAVDHAHRHGVVHRDLTARNILLDERGDALVTDFGIARLGTTPFTSAPTMLGTAHYASPEQIRGQRADARSDVYTVGVVLYEMLTGELPFHGDDAVAVALQQVNEPAPRPSGKRPDLPPAIEAVVMKALAKEPEARYQSAAEFGQALEAARAGGAEAGGAEAGEAGAAVAPAVSAGMVVRSDVPAPVLSKEGRSGEQGSIAGVSAPAGGAEGGDLGAAQAESAAAHTGKQAMPSHISPATGVADAVDKSGAGRVARDERLPPATIVAPAPVPDPGTRPLVHETATRVDHPRDARPAGKHRPRRWRLLLIAAAVVILAAAGGGAYWYFGRSVEVPNTLGERAARAVAQLRARGLDAVVQYGYVDGVARGRVWRQSPKEGAQLGKGEPVQVWVSRGPLHVQLPDLQDMTGREAARAIRGAGLVAAGSSGRNDAVEVGHVYRQDPAAGTSLKRGSKVTYWVSLGPPGVVVPDVHGVFYQDAVATLQEQGLQVDVQTSVGWGDTPLTVIGQDPAAGERVEEGTTVVIEVAVL